MGEGVRFYQDETLDFRYAGGSFGIQINYRDDPDKTSLAERKALLKAIGFKDNSLTLWQAMRIGIVLLVSVITGALLSSPLSTLFVTPVFRMLGTYSIEFEIR